MPEINNFYYIWYQWNYANFNETKNHIEKSLALIFGAQKISIFNQKSIIQEKILNPIKRPVNSDEINVFKSPTHINSEKSKS